MGSVSFLCFVFILFLSLSFFWGFCCCCYCLFCFCCCFIFRIFHTYKRLFKFQPYVTFLCLYHFAVILVIVMKNCMRIKKKIKKRYERRYLHAICDPAILFLPLHRELYIPPSSILFPI